LEHGTANALFGRIALSIFKGSIKDMQREARRL
jgi:hypothetical protein